MQREKMIGHLPPFKLTHTKSLMWLTFGIIATVYLPSPFQYVFIATFIIGIVLRLMAIAVERSDEISFVSVFFLQGLIPFTNGWVIGLLTLMNLGFVTAWLGTGDTSLFLKLLLYSDGILFVFYISICSGYLTAEYLGRSAVLLSYIFDMKKIAEHNVAWKELEKERVDEKRRRVEPA